MDYKAILNLMKEMNQTEITKLEIEEDGVRICMEKAVNTVAAPAAAQFTMAPAMQAVPVNQMGTVPMQMQVSQAQTEAFVTADTMKQDSAVQAAEKQEEENYKKIVSPMVGTFYTAPSPDKPSFVKVGDRVKKGQTVCIIEAMKLLNEIESELDGEIVKILVNNEEMVEFGQPLFLVK